MNHFELDGQGSPFILTGHMVAMDVDHCENISLTNFSIDWKKTGYFRGSPEEVPGNPAYRKYSEK